MNNYKVQSFVHSHNAEGKENDDNNIYLPHEYSMELMDDIAVFSVNAYKAIFRHTRKTANRHKKLLSVVVITNKRKNITIYRQYKYLPIKGINDNSVCLTPCSIRLLCNDNSEVVGKYVQVRRGYLYDVVKYYWEHPFHATRISFKLGLVALIISVISLILGVIGF